LRKGGEDMKRLAVLMLVSFGLSIMAAAASHDEDYPCKNDLEKYCRDIQPGEGRILRCLTLYEKDLTPSCKKELARAKKAIEEVQIACVDDYAIFCSSVLPGQGKIPACLEKNDKILTRKCKAHLKELMQKAGEIREQMQKK
jgi:hypothetical protein